VCIGRRGVGGRGSTAGEEAMGNLLKRIFGNREMRVLMLGLDSAGKTSALSSSCPTFSC
jgi:GTPase SAR1 family protein